MNNDTQPLTPDQVPPQSTTSDIISDESYQLTLQAWQKALRDYPKEPEHVHGPFTFIMNQNHNALRGCNTCGATVVGVMAGHSEEDIRWHKVQEPPEEDEEE